MHLVLLGDSILDNGAYVARGGSVVELLQEQIGPGVKASLVAQDGAVIADTISQLDRVPGDATHLVISAGGNDALRNIGVLMEQASTVAQALSKIEPVRNAFSNAFRELLNAASTRKVPTAICTIYDVRLPDPVQGRMANLALGVLNDVITREAVRRRWPVIDLRVLFNDPGDYANAIEPSAAGARKIAVVTVKMARSHDFGGPSSFYS